MDNRIKINRKTFQTLLFLCMKFYFSSTCKLNSRGGEGVGSLSNNNNFHSILKILSNKFS